MAPIAVAVEEEPVRFGAALRIPLVRAVLPATASVALGLGALFSLGIVLYEMLTGRLPFEGTSPTEIVDRILHHTPPPPSRFTSAVPGT